MRPEGKRLLILGAASGIGAASARLLAAEGWALALLDRSEEALAEVASETDATCSIVVDAAVPKVLGAAVAKAADELDGLDAVWSNVGVQTAGNVESASVDDLDRCYAVNLRSHFVVAKTALPHLRANGGGVLLITASNAGLQAESELIAYASTKAAAVALMRLLARDHASDGVRANALCPGFVDTPFNAPVWANFGGRDAFLGRVGELVPLGRMSTADEVAKHVRFLLSDEASFVTGHAFVADGGELVS